MRTVSIQALNLTHSLQWRRRRGDCAQWALLPLRLPALSLPPSLLYSWMRACHHLLCAPLAPPRSAPRAGPGERRVKCFPPHLKAILLPVPSAFAPRQRRNADVLSSFLIGKVHRGGRRARRASLSSVGRSQTSAPIFWCTALRCISCLYLRECNGAQLALFTPHEARLASP